MASVLQILKNEIEHCFFLEFYPSKENCLTKFVTFNCNGVSSVCIDNINEKNEFKKINPYCEILLYRSVDLLKNNSLLPFADTIFFHIPLDIRQGILLFQHCNKIIFTTKSPEIFIISFCKNNGMKLRKVKEYYVIDKNTSIPRSIKHRYRLCLNMIVRNEAHIIEEVLNDIHRYIDYYIICDTGSTDNTKDVIRKFFLGKKINGEIHDYQWKNFGYNRSVALDLCKDHCEYVWVIDADDRIIGDLQLPELTEDCYLLKIGNGFENFVRKQIFRVDRNWKYLGVLHEAPFSARGNIKSKLIEGNYYIDSRRLGDRSRDKGKYLNDAKKLEEIIPHEPENSMYVYYLGQSYRNCKEYEKSNHYYKKYFDLQKNPEFCYISLLQIAFNNQDTNKNMETIIDSFMKTYEYRPTRLEGIYFLIKYLENIGESKKIPEILRRLCESDFQLPKDNFFVMSECYPYISKLIYK